MSYIYLASPYWHEQELVRLQRVAAAKQALAHFLSAGFIVYSPIVHGHGVVDHLPSCLQNSHEFWMGLDLPFVAAADALWILCLDGWKESRGIAREIVHAQSLAIPVTYLPGDTLANPPAGPDSDFSNPPTPGVRSAGAPRTR